MCLDAEPYRSSIAEAEGRLRLFANMHDGPDLVRGLGRFVWLDRGRFDASDELTILGCTLWSQLDPTHLDIIGRSLNDFRLIKGFTPVEYNGMHERDRSWLNAAVAEIDRSDPQGRRRIAIFTHHAPLTQGTSDPKFQGSPINSCFSTDMSRDLAWTSPRVRFWAYGHTHYCCDFVRDGKRVYANQRGYVFSNEDANFRGAKIVEL